MKENKKEKKKKLLFLLFSFRICLECEKDKESQRKLYFSTFLFVWSGKKYETRKYVFHLGRNLIDNYFFTKNKRKQEKVRMMLYNFFILPNKDKFYFLAKKSLKNLNPHLFSSMNFWRPIFFKILYSS